METVTQQIKSAINESLLKYIGQTNSKDTIASIMRKFMVERDESVTKDAIDFEVDPNDDTQMIPKNLYTLLLMMGITVKYDDVKDKEEYVMDDGSKIEFTRGQAVQTFRPASPVSWVRLNCVVNDF
jgi:hypothetical protein